MKTITDYKQINALNNFTGFVVGQLYHASADGAAPTLPQGHKVALPVEAGKPIERNGFYVRFGGYEYIKPAAVVVIESPADWKAAYEERDRILRRPL